MPKMLAIAKKGQEFIYRGNTAHGVSDRSAEKIRDVLNDCNYMLKEGETWHVFDYDRYTNAAIFAETQRFTIRKGIVKRAYYPV